MEAAAVCKLQAGDKLEGETTLEAMKRCVGELLVPLLAAQEEFDDWCPDTMKQGLFDMLHRLKLQDTQRVLGAAVQDLKRCRNVDNRTLVDDLDTYQSHTEQHENSAHAASVKFVERIYDSDMHSSQRISALAEVGKGMVACAAEASKERLKLMEGKDELGVEVEVIDDTKREHLVQKKNEVKQLQSRLNDLRNDASVQAEEEKAQEEIDDYQKKVANVEEECAKLKAKLERATKMAKYLEQTKTHLESSNGTVEDLFADENTLSMIIEETKARVLRNHQRARGESMDGDLSPAFAATASDAAEEMTFSSTMSEAATLQAQIRSELIVPILASCLEKDDSIKEYVLKLYAIEKKVVEMKARNDGLRDEVAHLTAKKEEFKHVTPVSKRIDDLLAQRCGPATRQALNVEQAEAATRIGHENLAELLPGLKRALLSWTEEGISAKTAERLDKIDEILTSAMKSLSTMADHRRAFVEHCRTLRTGLLKQSAKRLSEIDAEGGESMGDDLQKKRNAQIMEDLEMKLDEEVERLISGTSLLDARWRYAESCISEAYTTIKRLRESASAFRAEAEGLCVFEEGEEAVGPVGEAAKTLESRSFLLLTSLVTSQKEAHIKQLAQRLSTAAPRQKVAVVVPQEDDDPLQPAGVVKGSTINESRDSLLNDEAKALRAQTDREGFVRFSKGQDGDSDGKSDASDCESPRKALRSLSTSMTVVGGRGARSDPAPSEMEDSPTAASLASGFGAFGGSASTEELRLPAPSAPPVAAASSEPAAAARKAVTIGGDGHPGKKKMPRVSPRPSAEGKAISKAATLAARRVQGGSSAKDVDEERGGGGRSHTPPAPAPHGSVKTPRGRHASKERTSTGSADAAPVVAHAKTEPGDKKKGLQKRGKKAGAKAAPGGSRMNAKFMTAPSGSTEEMAETGFERAVTDSPGHGLATRKASSASDDAVPASDSHGDFAAEDDSASASASAAVEEAEKPGGAAADQASEEAQQQLVSAFLSRRSLELQVADVFGSDNASASEDDADKEDAGLPSELQPSPEVLALRRLHRSTKKLARDAIAAKRRTAALLGTLHGSPLDPNRSQPLPFEEQDRETLRAAVQELRDDQLRFRHRRQSLRAPPPSDVAWEPACAEREAFRATAARVQAAALARLQAGPRCSPRLH
eukprot:TRINITY_DN15703_c0_g1_i1.p1 TRINITY_DN15703_c0_g1~~TRINITY_DN15703_c0_g1_i1.p1  ORF type:complete len:1159 (+),score=360.80 TRINITY_DN15703_c0_g1_i1:104-3580(+)